MLFSSKKALLLNYGFVKLLFESGYLLESNSKLLIIRNHFIKKRNISFDSSIYIYIHLPQNKMDRLSSVEQKQKAYLSA
jgi:hypothetical protein